MKTIALRNMFRLGILFCLAAVPLLADGLMRPTAAAYPKNFLRTRMTHVDVTLNGQIAVTKVYQEFVNEWTQQTSAVYSFPLPADARATDFFFWSNDTMYQATLKVKEQAENPGTGEGGIDALLNTYLGTNAIRIMVNDIAAGAIQKTQLEYISLCSYKDGRVEYRFPFNTQDFVSTPLEYFSLTVHINAQGGILESVVKGCADAKITSRDLNHQEISLERSKIYPTSDLTVQYRTLSDSLNVEMFAVDNDTLDGHFVMIVKPQTVLDSSSILRKNVVFLLDASASAAGGAFRTSVDAVRACLAQLRPTDYFNIATFNTTSTFWKTQSVQAAASAISEASTFLSGRAPSGGSNLAPALQSALATLNSDSLNNVLMVFSDGRSAADPALVAAQNPHKAGIFPVAIGTNVDRARLEMIAYQNFAFPTFLSISDPIVDRVLEVFTQVNYPILKDVHMEFGQNVYGLLPSTLQTVYYGSRFYITGRFRNPGSSTLALAAYSITGPRYMNFTLDFPSDKSANKFAERFWGKEKIDEIERRISVYGVTDSLKQEAIRYSLMYNIRCQFTAYIADKTKPVTSVVDDINAIEEFTLTRTGSAINLAWKLSAAEDSAGCNIYRSTSPTEGFVKLNPAALTGSSFIDRDAQPGVLYYYQLEIITRSGKRIFSHVLSSAGSVPPAGFALHQNYPNPFNPSTSISFDVAQAGDVRIALYDVLGREVAVLVNERMQPGVYERRWNAFGHPSGVYYCLMKAGGLSSVQKLVLAK